MLLSNAISSTCTVILSSALFLLPSGPCSIEQSPQSPFLSHSPHYIQTNLNTCLALSWPQISSSYYLSYISVLIPIFIYQPFNLPLLVEVNGTAVILFNIRSLGSIWQCRLTLLLWNDLFPGLCDVRIFVPYNFHGDSFSSFSWLFFFGPHVHHSSHSPSAVY